MIPLLFRNAQLTMTFTVNTWKIKTKSRFLLFLIRVRTYTYQLEDEGFKRKVCLMNGMDKEPLSCLS